VNPIPGRILYYDKQAGIDAPKIKGLFVPLTRDELHRLHQGMEVWIKHRNDTYGDNQHGFDKVRVIVARDVGTSEPHWMCANDERTVQIFIGCGAYMRDEFFKVADESTLAALLEESPVM
jgi:hypothetical protein